MSELIPGVVVVKALDRGAYGVVFLAKSSDPNIAPVGKVVVKISNADNAGLTQFDRLRVLNHPNILKYYHYEILEADALNLKRNVLVTEFCHGGNLFTYVYCHARKLCWTLAAAYAQDLLEALDYLHSQNIIHTDIKLQNLFLTRKQKNGWYLCAKVGDVDDPVYMESYISKTTDFSSARGTTQYFSPEIVRRFTGNIDDSDVIIGRSTDIWSAGCVISELSLGKTFDLMLLEKSKDGDKILDEDYAFLACMSGNPNLIHYGSICDALNDILGGCLVKNAEQRFKASRLLGLPYISNCENHGDTTGLLDVKNFFMESLRHDGMFTGSKSARIKNSLLSFAVFAGDCTVQRAVLGLSSTIPLMQLGWQLFHLPYHVANSFMFRKIISMCVIACAVYVKKCSPSDITPIDWTRQAVRLFNEIFLCDSEKSVLVERSFEDLLQNNVFQSIYALPSVADRMKTVYKSLENSKILEAILQNPTAVTAALSTDAAISRFVGMMEFFHRHVVATPRPAVSARDYLHRLVTSTQTIPFGACCMPIVHYAKRYSMLAIWVFECPQQDIVCFGDSMENSKALIEPMAWWQPDSEVEKGIAEKLKSLHYNEPIAACFTCLAGNGIVPLYQLSPVADWITHIHIWNYPKMRTLAWDCVALPNLVSLFFVGCCDIHLSKRMFRFFPRLKYLRFQGCWFSYLEDNFLTELLHLKHLYIGPLIRHLQCLTGELDDESSRHRDDFLWLTSYLEKHEYLLGKNLLRFPKANGRTYVNEFDTVSLADVTHLLECDYCAFHSMVTGEGKWHYLGKTVEELYEEFCSIEPIEVHNHSIEYLLQRTKLIETGGRCDCVGECSYTNILDDGVETNCLSCLSSDG